MALKSLNLLGKIGLGLVTFFVPASGNNKIKDHVYQNKRVSVIIPTYKPKDITYRLVHSLTVWNRGMKIILVDDNTPLSATRSIKILSKIKELSRKTKNIEILHTSENHLKANALNFGLRYLAGKKQHPDVVITFDDDVQITKDTLSILVDTLFANKRTGAVVSNAWVKNKKVNLLTRLQSLEYHGFNISKTADTGFLYGPLVMQGMLSAFKFEAIKQVNGFRTNKLIEDYDITVRIKNAGWRTAIAPSAHAWTVVPDSMGELWKQRVRWSYGGVIVVKDFWKEFVPVFQDLVGHSLFISLIGLVILSFIIVRHSSAPTALIIALFVLSVVQFILAFTFNILSLLTYPERDKWDAIIRLTIIPEFIYSNILSVILIGTYVFFLFNSASELLASNFPKVSVAQKLGHRLFKKFGYSLSWGTRA